mmetsp:Transcript_37084/g.109357  ORF Transcript_37084/g.109357 Transcript_37084/m.109357 type:complete len:589 (-) Transcript_37084:244-2010(-)
MSATNYMERVPQRSFTFDVAETRRDGGMPPGACHAPSSGLPYSVSAFESVARSEPRASPSDPKTHHAGCAAGLNPGAPDTHGHVGMRSPCAAPASPFSSVKAEFGAVLAAGMQSMPCGGEPAGVAAVYGLTSGSCFSKSTLSNAFSSFVESSMRQCGGPPHGVKAVCGKRSQMEDTFCIQTNFFDLPACAMHVPPGPAGNRLPVRIAEAALRALASPSAASTPAQLAANPSLGDMLHFFGVYDGHGGVDAANHCANRLHHHLSNALGKVSMATAAAELTAVHTSISAPRIDFNCMSNPSSSTPSAGGNSPCENPMGHGLKAIYGSDDSAATDGGLSGLTVDRDGSNATIEYQPADNICAALEDALREAFIKTDEEFESNEAACITGSTAVVALIGRNRCFVANCGDSRAVLCRAGRAVQLTDDHKPERQDEAERVERAGGHVLYWNGHRVMGVLAMSRAIGDHGLRPYIIPDPEVSVVARSHDDEFLILASDGLWDVMSNQETVDLAVRCLARAAEKGAGRKAAVRIAASVLTKAAIDRGSKDNVTVVIIDMRAPGADSMRLPASQSMHVVQPGAFAQLRAANWSTDV